jgi:hypothetical protein
VWYFCLYTYVPTPGTLNKGKGVPGPVWDVLDALQTELFLALWIDLTRMINLRI